MATSSEFEFITFLTSIQTNLYKFGGVILMSFGTVSCILSLAVFTKKNLRKNPCSIYLVAHNISNFLLIYTSLLSSTLSYGYDIDPSAYNIGFCRCRFYAMLLFDVLSPSYIILASVDRILVTSSKALTRHRSTRRLAYICIFITTLFWMSLHSHALILTDIMQLAPGFTLCYFQPGMHFILMGYYSLIIKGICVPLLMVVLGLWTLKNVRNVRHVNNISVTTVPVTINVHQRQKQHSKDHQFIRILLVDISVYIIFSLMVSIVLLYQQLVPNQSANLVQTEIQLFLLNVSVFSTYIPFCVGCYTNIMASKTFRHELKNVLMCK